MTKETSREIRSEITSEGKLHISIATVEKPVPKEDEVLIKVEAAPINPSDLALLISFASDPSTLSVSGSGNDTVASMDIHKGLIKAMTPRLDQSMQVGNEGAGIVETAGANAEHLTSSDWYSTHRWFESDCRRQILGSGDFLKGLPN